MICSLILDMRNFYPSINWFGKYLSIHYRYIQYSIIHIELSITNKTRRFYHDYIFIHDVVL